ncbi:MAG: hypothetical protein R3F35_08190 [Myxococcota bacterium]
MLLKTCSAVASLVVLVSLLAHPAIAQRSVPVDVVNDESAPVVVRPAIQPINASTQFSITGSVINPGNSLLYTVPPDARLAIETISVWSFTTNCAFYLKPSITLNAGGVNAEFRLDTPSRTYSSSGAYYTHQLTESIRLYADPGSSVYANAIRTEGGCSATIRVSIAGQRIPIQ